MDYSKELAEKYAKNRGNYRSSDDLLRPFEAKVGIEGKCVLDFGCGSGSEADRLISEGAKFVVGVDTSEKMIELAREKNIPNTSFIKTSGLELPFKEEEFDFVFSRFVLHYISDLGGQFKEIARTMKKGGYFLALCQCIAVDDSPENIIVPVTLGEGELSTNIEILSKSIKSVCVDLESAGIEVIEFPKVENKDSCLDSGSVEKYGFRNDTYIIFAQKK